MDSKENGLQVKIFEWFARKSRLIITLFHIFYYFLILLFAIGTYFILTKSAYLQFFYNLGRHLGQFALVLLGLAVLPGILGRLRIEIKLSRIINLFRRQLGITVFLFGFVHYSFVRMLPQLAGVFLFNIPSPILFENFGVLALFTLFWLFITSNNASVRKLGPWWKHLHRFVYVALWFLVLHTALQRISIWSAGIFTVAVLEVVSLIYDYFKKRNLDKVTTSTTSGGDGSTS